MKILFLALDIVIGSRTGDAIHVKELTKALAQLGNTVILVAAQTESSLQEKMELEKQPNISVYLTEKSAKFLQSLAFCRKIVNEHKPDIIYERRFSVKIGASISSLFKIPLVVEINGLVEEEINVSGTRRKEPQIISSTKKRMRKTFFEKANRIVAVTEGIRDGLNRLYDIPFDKIDVVHNGANTEMFKPMDQNECKKELGLDEHRKYTCFVGKLVSWQGVDYLLRAVLLVREKAPDSHFLVIGDGNAKKELQNLARNMKIEDIVTFTGSVPYEKVPKYINASDVCVALKRRLTSGYSSLKIYEYMACEKPIVASNTEGFDILEKYNLGLNVDPENENEVSEAILKLLKDEKLRKEMGKRGRETVVDHYSWMNVAKKVNSICEDVIK